MTPLYRCPICKTALSLASGHFICTNRHQFDVAKEGYVNLLPVQNKKSKNPGDNKEMVIARRAFLESGHYAFLRDFIAEHIAAHRPKNILDMGCGEGFYTQKVAESSNDANVYGIDIAKPAVRYAAKRYSDIAFSVGSIKETPFENGFADAILSIFAPLFWDEIDRVLHSDGRVFTVSPASHHLFELKSMIYQDVKLHSAPATPETFTLVNTHTLKEQVELPSDDVLNLIQMTPFAWKFKQEQLEEIAAKDKLLVTFHFLINEYKKR